MIIVVQNVRLNDYDPFLFTANGMRCPQTTKAHRFIPGNRERIDGLVGEFKKGNSDFKYRPTPEYGDI
jgi:hypothetical protein